MESDRNSRVAYFVFTIYQRKHEVKKPTKKSSVGRLILIEAAKVNCCQHCFNKSFPLLYNTQQEKKKQGHTEAQ